MSHQLTDFVEANGNRVRVGEAVDHFDEIRSEGGDTFVNYWVDELDELKMDRFGGHDHIEKVVY